jgi:hypothetical protein
MKARPLLIVLMILSAGVMAEARLGETETELIERFGEPDGRSKHIVMAQGKILELGPSLHFRQDDWSISCDMVDGRCMRISYHKPGDWTEDQVQLVLNSNSQGAKWTETTKPMIAKLQRDWKRADASKAVWLLGQGMTLTWDAYNKSKATLEERARVESAKKPKI